MSLKIKPLVKSQHLKPATKLNTQQLKCSDVQSQLQHHLSATLEQWGLPTTNVEVGWAILQDITFRAAADILDFVKRSHKDWFDENISQIKSLLNSMHAAHLRWIDDKSSTSKHFSYLQLRRLEQSRLHSMKDSWWAARAEEIQEAAKTKNLKCFYAGLKAVYGPSSRGIIALRISDGQHLITDPNKILKCVDQHFNGVLQLPLFHLGCGH